ncbi:TIGR02611 family protein [Lentzea sp. E54]|uniref:TIGR02611 family protein n=1 Tax=Lentzea xerophila TaxID=3435883 RepID=UPI003DA5451E
MEQAPTSPTSSPTRPTAPEAIDDGAASRPRRRRPLGGARTHLALVKGHLRAIRIRIEDRPTLRRAWQVCVTVVGFAVLGLGVLAIPYPGPGWLIVFAGLVILATEFVWAHRLLRYARRHYDGWTAWVRRQNRLVQFVVLVVTAIVLGVTLWLMGGLWLVAGQVGLTDWAWLQSPLFG